MRMGNKQVYRFYDKKEDGCGDEQEGNERVEEMSVEELAAIHREREVAKIRDHGDSRDEWGDEVRDERRHHRSESRADHDANGEVDHVPAQ